MLNKILIFPLIVLIKIYQYGISPWLGKNCRYEPTCSHLYGGSIKSSRTFKGIYLSKREFLAVILGVGSGYDPVPAQKDINIKKILTNQ